MTEPIRVLVADDEPTYRRLIKMVLDDETDIEVVAEASDGEETIALATEHAPQVIVMDIGMPKLSGIEAARVLNELHPSTRVLMLTASDEQSDLFEAIRAGASGYLLKDTDPDAVPDAVRMVHVGQAIMSSAMAAKLREELSSLVQESDNTALRPLLTNPELKVLHALADGLGSEEVGRRLDISPGTVNQHLNNLLHKLHLHHRMQVVADAVRDESDRRVRPVIDLSDGDVG